jgi:hypothetical protein
MFTQLEIILIMEELDTRLFFMFMILMKPATAQFYSFLLITNHLFFVISEPYVTKIIMPL